MKESRFLSRAISAIEVSAGANWRWLPLLLGWIVLRNLLESVLEPPFVMGFDWRGEISFPMQFLHFPLFYIALFLSLVLFLHAINKRPIGTVAGVVATGFGLLLVAPIIDALVSGGRGFDLKYMQGLGSVLWRFWDFSASAQEVSPGQRAEIIGACLLAAIYLFSTIKQRWGRSGPALLGAVCGGASVFLIIAFWGAWPSLLARISGSAGGSIDQQYFNLFYGPGLISDDSRRHALVILLPTIALLTLFLRQLDSCRFSAIGHQLAWTRLTYYSGLTLFGAVLAWALYRSYLPAGFSGLVDFFALAILWLAMVAAYLAAGFWNDLSDCEADKINEPGRLLVTGLAKPGEIKKLGAGCALFALFAALCVGYQQFLWMLVVLIISWFYSLPPARLKRWPIVATLTLAFLSLCSAATGFSLYADEMTLYLFPRPVAVALMIGVTFGFMAKDLKDVEGDSATGTRTIATMFGLRRARIIAAVLTGVGFAVIPWLLPFGGYFIAICALWAIASVIITLRIARPDSPLMILLILFAILMGVLVLHDPSSCLKLSPQSPLKLHGAIRAGEIDQRLVQLTEEDSPLQLPGVSTPIQGDLWRQNIQLSLGILDQYQPGDLLSGDALQMALAERAFLLRTTVESPEKVFKLYRELIKLRPLQANYWEGGVMASHLAGDDQESLKRCRQAIELGIRPALFYQNAAALQAKDGKGEFDLEGAFLFNGDQAMLEVIAGDLRSHQGRAESALGHYRRAVDLDPTLPEASGGLGEALYASGRLAEAIEQLKRAAELAPLDVVILNNFGVAKRDGGDLSEAALIFTRAHQLAPAFFEPIYNLGVTAEKQERYSDARRWYEHADQIRPDFPPVRDALSRLINDQSEIN